jgi:hypothetical protein
VKDLVGEVREQLQRRLAEIDAELRSVQGLIDEKARIERALSTEPFAQPARRPSSSNSGSGRRTAPRRRRSRSGNTKERFVAFVRERPGVSVAEVAKGIDVATAYGQNLASRLVKEGAIERVELPSGGKGLRVSRNDAT